MWVDGYDALDDLLVRICAALQITSTQHQLAEDRYGTIGKWLEAPGSPLAPFGPVIYPQGSLRIGTTVKPIGHQEYDLDLVCEFRKLDWRRLRNPVVLLEAVETRLRAHQTYRAMLERKKRCLRVCYTNDFHLDILPACPDPDSGRECIVVPDRALRDWMPSNPNGYATWFEARAASVLTEVSKRVEPLPAQEPLELKAPLKRVVQLLKRWRDLAYRANPDLAPVSIVLTTLAASYYRGEDSPARALSGILDATVESLPPEGYRLEVRNPTNEKEDFGERWDAQPGAYQAFVTGITAFRTGWRALLGVRGLHLVTAGLSQLFGEDVAKSAVRGHTEAIEKARSSRQLGVQRGTGAMISGASPGAVPVKRNTFHGV